jgi:2-keto-myo-inositol isomerase
MGMRASINGASTHPYPLEEDLRAAAAAGFPLVELWAGKLPAYLAQHRISVLRGTLADAGLGVAAICPYGLRCFGDWRKGLPDIERAAAVAAEIGAPALLVCPDAPGSEDAGRDLMAWAGERARVYADAAQREGGVRLAIEPLGRHPFVPGPTQAMALIHAAGDTPGLGLMMDTFHYYKSGVTPEEIAAVPPDRWVILHVNDCPPGDPAALQDADRLYPGEGILPLVETLAPFQRMGFQGAASVEVFRPAYWQLPIDEINRRAYAAVTRLLEAVAARAQAAGTER